MLSKIVKTFNFNTVEWNRFTVWLVVSWFLMVLKLGLIFDGWIRKSEAVFNLFLYYVLI